MIDSVLAMKNSGFTEPEILDENTTVGQWSHRGQVLFVLVHILLGYLFRIYPEIVTIHAYTSLAFGLLFVLLDRQPKRVIYTAAYITGAEVIWRALDAAVFWETGKYGLIVLFSLSILKYGRGVRKAGWPVIYFTLLIQGIFIMPFFDRQEIAFNLAGPLALALAVVFFSMLRIDQAVFKKILVALLAPTTTLATYVLGNILVSTNIIFGRSSNSQTSGDFGPNQVSVILAAGAFAAVYFALLESNRLYKMFFLLLSLWLLGQSALTFSRSGLWVTGLSLGLTGLYLLQDSRKRLNFLIASILVGSLAYFFVLPVLESFTQNAFSVRFVNMELTGRNEIIKADWMVFQRYPLFGVGPGQSKPLHALTYLASNAHTEYSRMLAEHGVLGLLSLMILIFIVFNRFISRIELANKGYILGLTAWAILFMFVSGTRLVIPSLFFGLSAARFDLFSEKDKLNKFQPNSVVIFPYRRSTQAGQGGKVNESTDCYN